MGHRSRVLLDLGNDGLDHTFIGALGQVAEMPGVTAQHGKKAQRRDKTGQPDFGEPFIALDG